MLSKYNNSRTHFSNLKLGGMTAFSAGMVNVASVIIFFAFTSNVTGHVAILAQEIANKNYHQVGVVLTWLALFFGGCFNSNFIIINSRKFGNYFSHSMPLILEIICLLFVGIYGHYYQETLQETEILVGVLLFAMGLQNGLTASISNGAVKTTHMTGLFTDLAISLSLYTKKENRNKLELKHKIRLLTVIGTSYLSGGIFSGFLYKAIGFNLFFVVSFILLLVLTYDLVTLTKFLIRKKQIDNAQPIENRI